MAFGLIFLIFSVMTYWLYAKDKTAAKLGTWRVSEKSLHIAALCFGWPGALIAQERLRHKTKKQSFRALFWFTVCVNVGMVVWLHSPHGNSLLRGGAHSVENIVISSVPHEAFVSGVLFLTKFHPMGGTWFH